MYKLPATSGANLPPEIIEAILPFFPAKSLGRFKSVSKRWNSLISDTQFIKNHLHQNIDRHQTSKLIVVSDTESLYSVDTSQLFQRINSSDDTSVTGKEVSFQSHPSGWREIWGSCNGLVLAQDENDAIILMNPTTQELWKVPPSPFDGDFYVRYGFGYDSSADDYQVLSISFWDPQSLEHRYGPDLHASVYSLRNSSWRKLPDSPYDHVAYHLCSGAFTNQDLNFYWYAYSLVIVAFSLANEEFTEIKLPNSVANNKYWSYPYHLLHLGGKLGLFIDTWQGYELWAMEEESWTRVCSLGREREIKMHRFKTVCFVEGSNRVILFYDEKEGEVVVYDIDERRCTNVRILGVPTRFRFHDIGGTYVETLESPKRVLTTS